MKNLFFIVSFLLSFSFNAQVLPLNTYYTDITGNSYLKDLDNILPRYVGVWQANYNGTNIYLTIDNVTKHPVRFGDVNFYNDILFVRYIVKDQNGVILQSTMNHSVTNANIESIVPYPNNTIGFRYSGGDCNVGNGRVFLQYVDPTHIKWTYYPNSLLLPESDCPKGSDLKVYLPKTEDLVFTKQ
ncbi:hypothetical protein VO54_01415 [Elizabethkingia miricola]|nr:hypothetical protein VO54_01415 [Elizabethkingia miricola]